MNRFERGLEPKEAMKIGIRRKLDVVITRNKLGIIEIHCPENVMIENTSAMNDILDAGIIVIAYSSKATVYEKR